MIEVTVGEHHCHGLEPVLHDQLGDTISGIHTRIDDHAFFAWRAGNQVAVGLPRPRGEGRYEHTFETIGTIGQD